MKRIASIIAAVLMTMSLSAQNVYWVFLADKAGTTFDPYSYFDASVTTNAAPTFTTTATIR